MRACGTTIHAGLFLLLAATTTQAGTSETTQPAHAQIKQTAPATRPDRPQPSLRKLKALFEGQRGRSERDKIEAVNRFFNAISFATDSENWGQPDYWATPRELLERAAGDCEDYTIGKYFALRKLGIPLERLRITYMSSSLGREAHMVLVYFAHKKNAPWVLDNLTDKIIPLQQRADLTMVYAFNEMDLWYVRDEHTIRAGSAKRIAAWKKVLDKTDWSNLFRS